MALVLIVGIFLVCCGIGIDASHIERHIRALSPDAQLTDLTGSIIEIMPNALIIAGVLLIVAALGRRLLQRLNERIGSYLEQIPEHTFLWALLSVALTVRLAWVLAIPSLPVVDFAYYEEKAWQMAQGLGYQANGKPTAFRPPGYILWLAGIYSLCGRSLLAGQVANVLLSTFVCLLVYRIASKGGLSRRASRIAALIVTLFPSQIFYCSLTGTEGLFTFLFMAALVVWVQGFDQASWKTDVSTGVLLGLATLVRPVSLFLPGLFLVHLKLYGKGWIESVRRPFLVGVAMLVPILPWSIRNLIVMKSPILISTNGGITLWMGLNEHATGTFMSPPAESPLRAIEDEVEKSRQATRLARLFVREHPGRVVILSLKKFFYLYATDISGAQFSFAHTARPVALSLKVGSILIAQGFYLVVGVFALWGVARFLPLWRHYPVQGLLLGSIIYFTVLYAGVFHGEDRFHHPLIPVFSILAAHGMFSSRTSVS